MKSNRARKQKKRVLQGWQRRGIVFCLAGLLLAGALHLFRMYRRDMLPDQNEAQRWAPDGGSAQVSVFFSPDAKITQDNLKELAYNIREGLEEDSLAREEGRPGRDCMDAYSTTGALTLRAGTSEIEVDAVGIGGDFFAVHPLEMVSGDYFAGDDLMKDKILLDEETAWKLFGSPDVAGQTVVVGDMAHTVAGVYHRESGGFYEKAGLDRATVFVSYKTVVQYGIEKSFSGSEGGDEEIGTNNVADASGLVEALARRSGPAADAGPAALLERAGSLFAGSRNEDADGTAVNPSTAASGDVPDVKPDGGGNGQGSGNYGYEQGSVTGGRAGETSDASAAGGVTGRGNANYMPSGSGAEIPSVPVGPGEGPSADGGEEETQPGEAEQQSGQAAGNGAPAAGPGETGEEVASLPEGTGTQNTAAKDTGKVTCYEIVMPNPVSGYAEKLVRSKIGLDEDSCAVVENTGRFMGLSLASGWGRFWTRSMRLGNVPYPFWENVARGWEDILSLVFLLECILVAVPALYALYLVLYYLTHKTWTLAGIFVEIGDRIYDRQARRRYPELARQLDAERLAREREREGMPV